jgi:hypothetical protein
MCQDSVLDEPIAEASCIVADMDKWYVFSFVTLIDVKFY